MRKFGLISLFTFIVLSVFAQKPDPDFFDKIAFQEKANLIIKSTFVESQNYALTDVVYQRMEWEINPNVLYIKGVVTTYFKSKTQNLSEIDFDLNSLMTVDSVVQNQKKITFTQAQNKIQISLPESLNEGQLDSVSIFYQGIPANSGFDTFSKTVHSGVPNIWTLSEPYGAMEWWPCKQSLVDKIDSIDIIVSSPQPYRTASIGVLVSETVDNEIRRMHWKHRFPIATYLIAISVTNYVDYSDYLELDNGSQIEILNYVYPENLADAQSKTPVTAEIMKLFNELIGEYPFAKEKYGHAQFGWGGGMEHQTMSFMYNFSFDLIAHELAHQWFGDYITLGSWQDIWLNEGFATYLTGLSYEHLLDGVWWPRWRRLNVERIVSEPDGSVFVKDTTNINTLFSGRLSYSKGAHILHMLRWILGDNDFYLGIQNYFKDPEIANGFARTYQFVEHLENVADTSLTEFFNDWLYGEGFPNYSAHFMPTETNSLKITLSQVTTHPSVDFFEMPVPVRVYNLTKTDSADFRLIHTTNNQEFIVEPGFKVAELKIDPEYWLVSKTAEIVNAPWIESSNEILIYPNPFSEKISVFMPSGQQLVSTKLFSSDGTLLTEIIGDKTTFNWPNIAKGMYIIQIKTSQEIFEMKIVKQ
ncbi:MAG: T9SS type A sorting domain-containing protein [Draconibacterium sp.]|nr:T9SS type A sorting domain-containing protein [Draconibacterium sp.]